MSGSEIVRILQKIREEEEAAKRGLEGPAIMGTHEFITKKMENMGRYIDVLAELTGSKDVAMELVIADQLQDIEIGKG
jgi:hypothetical protein